MQDKLNAGIAAIESKMVDLEGRGCLRGSISAAEATKLIEPTSTIAECVSGAIYVQVRSYKLDASIDCFRPTQRNSIMHRVAVVKLL